MRKVTLLTLVIAIILGIFFASLLYFLGKNGSVTALAGTNLVVRSTSGEIENRGELCIWEEVAYKRRYDTMLASVKPNILSKGYYKEEEIAPNWKCFSNALGESIAIIRGNRFAPHGSADYTSDEFTTIIADSKPSAIQRFFARFHRVQKVE